jgi:hypothetical protein
MPHGVRRRRLERQLRRAGNPSIYSNRNDHGAKRCRSYQASIRSPKHNQQFHPSSYRPADRACRRHRDDRRDDDARRRLKSQHGSSVVTFRPGLQFHNLRHANCRHYTRIRRNSHRGYGNLHGPNHPPNPASVTVTVTPQADPTKKAQATMAVEAGVNVSLTQLPQFGST